MLAPLLRLAPDPGICSRPSFDWPLTREYARSPPSIGDASRTQLRRLRWFGWGPIASAEMF
eukprot:4029136-Pyramimonas_sp.AAC.1